MTETPEEMYNRLKEEADNDTYSCIDAWALLNHYRSQVQVLREALKEVDNADERCRQKTHAISHIICSTTKIALAATKDKWGE